MSDFAIRVQQLSKQYEIGEQDMYRTLRDSIAGFVTSPFRRSKQQSRTDNRFWALRDITFDVKHGELVGIIGRNGAGKSTLLKVLSRITEPTKGRAEIHGRVGSLLEVGTGFHPELTGRENIYFNGAILGMSKAEITRKLDAIIDFAGIDQFVDTPVRRYSSGMYVRLAFAVAAHLEPEILFVDEVLAVGDITFQKKCLGKMGDVARAGRTVVFVSHNMAAINALCSRCIILEKGAIEFDGSTAEATARYYAESLQTVDGSDLSTRPRKGNGKARFTAICVQPLDSVGCPLDVAYPGCNLSIHVELQCESDFAPANLAIIFYDSSGYRVIDTNTAQKGEFLSLQAGQIARASFLLREVLLRPGKYLVGLWLGRQAMEVIDHIEHAATLDVMVGEESSQYSIVFPGVYLCRFEQNVSISQPSLAEGARS